METKRGGVRGELGRGEVTKKGIGVGERRVRGERGNNGREGALAGIQEGEFACGVSEGKRT